MHAPSPPPSLFPLTKRVELEAGGQAAVNIFPSSPSPHLPTQFGRLALLSGNDWRKKYNDNWHLEINEKCSNLMLQSSVLTNDILIYRVLRNKGP